MAYPIAPRSRDPRMIAPVDSYMTDGDVLVAILEVDASGALAEDVCGGQRIWITDSDLLARWRHITPAPDAP